MGDTGGARPKFDEQELLGMSEKEEKSSGHEPEHKKGDDSRERFRKIDETTRYFVPTPLPDDPKQPEKSHESDKRHRR